MLGPFQCNTTGIALRRSIAHLSSRTLHSSTLKGAISNTTINENEVAHFSRLSSEWWDEQGEFSFLHKMNPVRMKFITEKLLEIAREENINTSHGVRDVLRGLDVLDVGCGGGLLCESLARMGANTVGIDASKSNIAIASLHASFDPGLRHSSGIPRLTYLNTPAETLLAEQKRYDVVCALEVIEHVDNPTVFISTCAQLLKPGGHLFLSTISRTPLAYILTIFFAEDILSKVSKGTHTYSKFVKPSELIQFFREYRSPSTSQNTESSSSSSPSRPWITSPVSSPYLNRLEAECRGLIYNPVLARWHLAPRDAVGALECSYLFWVRSPES